MKRPQAINFSRKNDIHPFDSPSSLEFFAQKNDASLFVTGLHSKKRPNDLIFTRMFDGRVLDMIELGVENIRTMGQFEVSWRWLSASRSADHSLPTLPEDYTEKSRRRPQAMLRRRLHVGYAGL